MQFASIMLAIGNAIDAFGVVTIIIGVIGSTCWFFVQIKKQGLQASYVLYRQSVGKSILLGLEFLVAGDIIRTVAVSPTLMNVAVLAGIVLIRTFLSIALQMEIDNRVPWQKEVNS